VLPTPVPRGIVALEARAGPGAVGDPPALRVEPYRPDVAVGSGAGTLRRSGAAAGRAHARSGPSPTRVAGGREPLVGRLGLCSDSRPRGRLSVHLNRVRSSQGAWLGGERRGCAASACSVHHRQRLPGGQPRRWALRQQSESWPLSSVTGAARAAPTTDRHMVWLASSVRATAVAGPERTRTSETRTSALLAHAPGRLWPPRQSRGFQSPEFCTLSLSCSVPGCRSVLTRGNPPSGGFRSGRESRAACRSNRKGIRATLSARSVEEPCSWR
jgi:hypothetical protein